MLVCHDMQGGYGQDSMLDGSEDPEYYTITHWHLIDIFVYFSHHLVTIPPPSWTNCCHLHGVKVNLTCHILPQTRTPMSTVISFLLWLLLRFIIISNLSQCVDRLLIRISLNGCSICQKHAGTVNWHSVRHNHVGLSLRLAPNDHIWPFSSNPI